MPSGSRQYFGVFFLLAFTVVLFLNPVETDAATRRDLTLQIMKPSNAQLNGYEPLLLVFSLNVVGQDELGAIASEDVPVRIKPELPGSWQWKTPAILEFRPEGHYPGGMKWDLVIDTNQLKRLGFRFKGDDKIRIQTAPFRCLSVDLNWQSIRNAEMQIRFTSVLKFNQPVSPETLRDLARLTYGQQQIEFVEAASTDDGLKLTLKSGPVQRQLDSDTARLTVEEVLTATDSSEELDKPVQDWSVVPAIERLHVHSAQFHSNGPRKYVQLEFADDIDYAALREALTIDPAVDDLVIKERWRDFELEGDWKAGVSYRLDLDPRLRSRDGKMLGERYSTTLRVLDLDPWVQFAEPGHLLPLRGDRRLAVTTMNVDSLELRVFRVYPNNLVPFLRDRGLNDRPDHWGRFDQNAYGSEVAHRRIPASPAPQNTETVTPVELASLLSDDSRGVFRVRVSDDQKGAERWIVASDLGIVVKRSTDQLLAAIVSFSETQPVPDVKLSLMSYNNQLLGTMRTGADGTAVFSGLDNTGGSRPFVLVAERGGDMSFLALDTTAIPTGDLDVGGVEHPHDGYRSYLWGDRDIYRPGETAHLAWLVRDPSLHPPADSFPLLLRVVAPSGQTHVQRRVQFDELGAGSIDIEFPGWVRTGTYTVRLMQGEANTLGETKLRIEEFVPDRMTVKASFRLGDDPVLLVGQEDSPTLELSAHSLYGPPAAGCTATGRLLLRPEPVRLKAWPNHVFGDPGSELGITRIDLSEATTDEEGTASWRPELPTLSAYHGWINVSAQMNVAEAQGGRTVQGRTALIYSPVERLIGLHNLTVEDGDYIEPDQPITLSAVLADLKGVAVAQDSCRMSLYQRRWRSRLERQPDGRYRYRSTVDLERIWDRFVDLEADATELVFQVPGHGRFELVLETPSGDARATQSLYVYGWGYNPWSMENPELVSLKLDRERYRPGEAITASIEAPFSGLLLLTVERDRVLHREWVVMTENTATVKIPMPQGALPNVYLVATLLRPRDQLEPFAPARAFGAVPVMADPESAVLQVTVDTPDHIRPRSTLPVRVSLPDLRNGREARVTVAAVDEGILQLTDFTTPDPLDFFLERRRLSVTSYDIWSLLLPDYEAVVRNSSPGGDDDAEAALMRDRGLLNPLATERIKPVALWSGLLTPENGVVEVPLEIPEYTGRLRIMVTAATEDRFGAADGFVRVTDPYVITPNLPLALAPGDTFLVTVPLYDGRDETSTPGPVTLELTMSGPISLVDGSDPALIFETAPGDRVVATYILACDSEGGEAGFVLTARGGGEESFVEVDIPVRPIWPRQGRVTSGSLKAGESRELTLRNTWFGGTGRGTLQVSSLPIARFSNALAWLLHYPYGCAEQTTSTTFPLLYFGELAAALAPDTYSAETADYYVNAGLDRLLSMHRPGRGFAYWPSYSNSTAYPWVSVYATHFLLEAQYKGYVVPQPVLDDALNYLDRVARDQTRFDERWWSWSKLRARAYACYVLARAGRPSVGTMDALNEDHLEELDASARALLAGAYALSGDTDTFTRLFPAGLLHKEPVGRNMTWWSASQADAICLEVLSSVQPDHPQVPVLLGRLAETSREGRWSTTQENGFAMLALGKLVGANGAEPSTGRVLRTGTSPRAYEGMGLTLVEQGWVDGTVTIEAQSGGVTYYSLLEEGVPTENPEQDLDAGLAVERVYMTERGALLDLAAVEQGQVVLLRLRLSSSKGDVDDIVISDLLPGGFEIEDPQLTADEALPWLQGQLENDKVLEVDHVEARNDRLLVFTKADGKTRNHFALLRAVTAGHFIVPAVKAEAMYDPTVRSIRSPGRIRIEAR